MAVSKTKQKKPDPCSFVIFGVTGDLTHRLVMPALYNLAANDLLPEKFCVVGVARKGTSSDALRDDLMKGLRKFATRSVDDAIAERLLACVTRGRGRPEGAGIVRRDARSGSKSWRKRAAPAETGCSIWQRRPTPFCRLPANSAAPAC